MKKLFVAVCLCLTIFACGFLFTCSPISSGQLVLPQDNIQPESPPVKPEKPTDEHKDKTLGEFELALYNNLSSLLAQYLTFSQQQFECVQTSDEVHVCISLTATPSFDDYLAISTILQQEYVDVFVGIEQNILTIDIIK